MTDPNPIYTELLAEHEAVDLNDADAHDEAESPEEKRA